MYGKKGFCLFLTLAVLCVSLLSACGKKTERGPLVAEEIYHKETDGSVVVRTVWTYDENGVPTEKTIYDDLGTSATYALDEKGNETSSVYYNADGSVQCRYTYTNTYDGNGDLTEQVTMSVSDKGETQVNHEFYTYAYDEADRLTEYTERTFFGVHGEEEEPTVYRCTYAYDRDGKRTERVEYREDGSVDASTFYEYDEVGKLTKETTYDGVGLWEAEVAYEYDETGRLAKKTERHSGQFGGWTEYKYVAEAEETEETESD